MNNHTHHETETKSGSDLEINSSLSKFKNWSSHQVGEWLTQNGFKEYRDFFVKHEITGDLLIDLNYNILGEIGVISVGERARILQAIKKSLAPCTPRLPLAGGYKPNNHLVYHSGARYFISLFC